MLPVIRQLLAAEQEAKELVARARAEAAEKLRRARTEMEESATRNTADAQAEAERLVEQTVAAARSERDRRLAEFDRSLRQELTLDASRLDQLADGVARCIAMEDPLQP